jgi:hypothetical protein
MQFTFTPPIVRRMLACFGLATALLSAAAPLFADKAPAEAGFTPLFDGKTLEGWEGKLKWFRIEDQAIVAGTLKENIPNNEFLCTEQPFDNFELRLQFKVLGEGANAGIQFHSQRVPNHHEVVGYQADLGEGWYGALYDESRRNRVLAKPDEPELNKVLKRGEWNDYTIRAVDGHIQLWINGQKTVDYREGDKDIPQTGYIALQIHGGKPSEAHYRNIRIKKL